MAAKRSKPSVDYREAGGERTCDNCASMNPDGSCKKVQGQVKPAYVCNLWTAGRKFNPNR